MSDNLSVLSKARQAYKPKLPAALRAGALKVVLNKEITPDSPELAEADRIILALGAVP